MQRRVCWWPKPWVFGREFLAAGSFPSRPTVKQRLCQRVNLPGWCLLNFGENQPLKKRTFNHPWIKETKEGFLQISHYFDFRTLKNHCFFFAGCFLKADPDSGTTQIGPENPQWNAQFEYMSLPEKSRYFVTWGPSCGSRLWFSFCKTHIHSETLGNNGWFNQQILA